MCKKHSVDHFRWAFVDSTPELAVPSVSQQCQHYLGLSRNLKPQVSDLLHQSLHFEEALYRFY